ncbi:ybjT [Symbiodinium necroappetens]|uniref:YbjT protein n=1 Tax=Symbiodinium necroappetens TaxID=1628268 RepID=A0A813BHA2_9DINO|nr:ybjT [Symbiodinium necroappetens]
MEARRDAPNPDAERRRRPKVSAAGRLRAFANGSPVRILADDRDGITVRIRPSLRAIRDPGVVDNDLTFTHRTSAGGERLRVFLTGATGYIGGRLGPELLEKGHEIVCAVREPRKLDTRPWSTHPRVKVVRADIADTEALADAMKGCDAAYYLVHSMESGTDDFAERDRELAESFTRAAKAASVGRIIYLGGLGELGSDLSEHLRSRREVEEILEGSGIPVTSFRAAIIIGSGSASFEILRYLVERLPIMTTPRWVSTECQPISVVDVLHWLVECLDTPESLGQRYDIGGPEVLSYRKLMQVMAEELGLAKRIIIPLPVLTPKLSSLWIGLVTPVSPAIARPLAEGLRNRVVVRDDAVQRDMPRETSTPSEAIGRALVKIRTNSVLTRWSAAGRLPGDPDWAGGTLFVDRRDIEIDADAEDVYAAVCRVGGGNGWYAADILWKIRGLLDQAVGGPGVRRGRRHPDDVEYGEALDFWRVTGVEPGRSLDLRAEMKLPGVAGLQFEIEPIGEARSKLTMTARFRPKGLFGLMYWYAVLPFHNIVFRGMLRGMKRSAEHLRGERLAGT